METIIKSKKSLATLCNARSFDGAKKLALMAEVRRVNMLIQKRKTRKRK
jgi:hypothetical protein